MPFSKYKSKIRSRYNVPDQLVSPVSPVEWKTDTVHWSPHSWMTDVFRDIEHLAITQVRCVGTHNSGTFGVTSKSKVAPDAPDVLSSGCLSCLLWCLFRDVVISWAKCQLCNIYEQLSMGIRYLDLRVVPHQTTQALVTTHSVYGAPLDEVLRDVVRFLDRPECGKEFVIMDFQHVFCSKEYMDSYFFPQLEPILDRCVFRDTGLQRPLKDVLQTNSRRRIFLFIGCEFDSQKYVEVFPRSQFLDSSWKDARTIDSLLEQLEEDTRKMAETVAVTTSPDDDEAAPRKVTVTQAILTPDGGTIVRDAASQGCCCCCSSFFPLERISVDVNIRAIQWFSRWNTQHQVHGAPVPSNCGVHRNVLMLDFSEVGAAYLRKDGMELMANAVGWCVLLNQLFPPIPTNKQ